MSENNAQQKSSISQAETYEAIGAYWDTHSLDEHWDKTHDVEFTINAPRPHRVTIEPDVYERITTQAHTRGLSPETPVNLWLLERLQSAQ